MGCPFTVTSNFKFSVVFLDYAYGCPLNTFGDHSPDEMACVVSNKVHKMHGKRREGEPRNLVPLECQFVP